MQWPKVDAIVGNPPYLGRRAIVEELGVEYSRRLAAAYPNVGGVSDFVCYWFPRTQDHLPPGGRASPGHQARQRRRGPHPRRLSQVEKPVARAPPTSAVPRCD